MSGVEGAPLCEKVVLGWRWVPLCGTVPHVLVAPSPEALPRQAVSATDTDAVMSFRAQIGLWLGRPSFTRFGSWWSSRHEMPRGGVVALVTIADDLEAARLVVRGRRLGPAGLRRRDIVAAFSR